MAPDFYKNECPFEGSRSLVLMEHMSGAYVPEKCLECEHNFEGECKLLRNPNKRLDYGYCGVDGDTRLDEYPGTAYPIPRKCAGCQFFRQHDAIKRIVWCDKGIPEGVLIGRGLDYGDTDDNPHPNPTIRSTEDAG